MRQRLGIAAALLGDKDGYEEGRAMIEAGGLTVLSTTLLKYAAGRSRPDETSNVNDWRTSGSSFPSLHASAAFAVGTVFAESGNDSDRWMRRLIGYGVGLATSYARMHGDVHWFSDTVAGAALGIATAQFTMNHRDERRLNRAGEFSASVAPLPGGAMLFVSKTW
jgi:membrane-associated phospholipid phosphatase